MSVINIRALFDWKDIQTGLQNMKGQFQRVGAEVDKGFSVGTMLRNFVGGFIGLNLVDKLVSPFRQAAEYAEKIANLTRNLGSGVAANISGRNGDVRQLATLRAEQARNDKRLAELDQWFQAMPDFSNPNIAELIAKNPRLANPFVFAAEKGQYDTLLAEREQRLTEGQQRKNEIDALAFSSEVARRRAGAERSGIYDERRVARGEMSQVEALQAAADRATAEWSAVMESRGPGAETDQAFNAMLRAQNALLSAEAAAERFRLNGVLPQISSSSLAQLGGGGNVNVFGGRPGEGVSELREQTRLMRSIDGKIGAGVTGSFTDVGL